MELIVQSDKFCFEGFKAKLKQHM